MGSRRDHTALRLRPPTRLSRCIHSGKLLGPPRPSFGRAHLGKSHAQVAPGRTEVGGLVYVQYTTTRLRFDDNSRLSGLDLRVLILLECPGVSPHAPWIKVRW